MSDVNESLATFRKIICDQVQLPDLLSEDVLKENVFDEDILISCGLRV